MRTHHYLNKSSTALRDKSENVEMKGEKTSEMKKITEKEEKAEEKRTVQSEWN